MDKVDHRLSAHVIQVRVLQGREKGLVHPEDHALTLDEKRIGDPLHELVELALRPQEGPEDVLRRLVLPRDLVEERALASERAQRRSKRGQGQFGWGGRDVEDAAARAERHHDEERRLVSEESRDGPDAAHAGTKKRLAAPIRRRKRQREAKRTAGALFEPCRKWGKIAGPVNWSPIRRRMPGLDDVRHEAEEGPGGGEGYSEATELLDALVRTERGPDSVGELREIVPRDAGTRLP